MNNLKNKFKELEVYEKHLKSLYPNLSEFEVLQIAVKLMNCNTKQQVKDTLNYLTK